MGTLQVSTANDRRDLFVKSLLNDDTLLVRFLNQADRQRSERFGISYEHIQNKFLIGDGIDPAIVAGVKSGSLTYSVTDSDLVDGYSRIRFSAPAANYHKDYYFHGDSLVAPIRWHTREWNHRVTKYFDIYAPDSTVMNEYTIASLEEFVNRMMGMLGYSANERTLIERKKILYFLCRNEDEIERLTGSRTRGLSLLSYDAVVSFYPCHFHEISHLLINLKLHKLPLYTNPFLQEGFAVAAGGRGGISTAALFPMAVFLERSGMLDYAQICSLLEFRQNDPSLTYPLSGLYNSFLLNEWGSERYLSFYRKYSGDAIDSLNIDTTLFPPRSRWKLFMDSIQHHPAIALLSSGGGIYNDVVSSGSASVSMNDSLYYFRLNNSVLFYPVKPSSYILPKALADEVPGILYQGKKISCSCRFERD